MSVGRLTPERRRELTREALLDAAASVFARRGYDAGTLEEIAEAAGFTTGAVYSNFGGKQDLFLAVLDRRNEGLTQAYRDLFEHPSGATVPLSAVATFWTQHELADRDSLRLMLEFRLAALRDPEVAERLAEFERRTEESITRFVADRLSETAGSGEPPVPVEEFAVAVHAASQGIWQHIAVCSADHSKLFETFLQLLTGWLSPPKRRSRAKPTDGDG
jgi:AcrR family transcriptional regulator